MTGEHESDAGPEALDQAILDATFAGFFSRHRPAVERFLSSWERDRGMVEEATQDAFAAAGQKWEDVRRHDKPLAWVLLVARRKLLTYQRNRKRRPLELLGDGLDEQPTAPSTAHEAAEYVTRLLQRLPPHQAEVMRLSLDGWSGREIAAMTGHTYNTVRSYRADARQRMQQLAEQDGFAEPTGRRRG